MSVSVLDRDNSFYDLGSRASEVPNHKSGSRVPLASGEHTLNCRLRMFSFSQACSKKALWQPPPLAGFGAAVPKNRIPT